MTHKLYIFGFFLGFIISLGVWLLILFNIDPYKADFISLASFFASFFLMFTCLLTLIGYYVRYFQGNKEVVYSILPISFRQAFLVSLALAGLLFLSSIGVLTWWIAGIWVVLVLITEFFFKSRAA